MKTIRFFIATYCRLPTSYYQLLRNHKKRVVIQKEDGFVFVTTAIVVSVILGLSVLYLYNSVSLNITEATEVYSASQSYWTSISGIEYSIDKSADEMDEIPGSYAFYNSTVTLQLSYTDRFGTPLSSDRIRVISRGVHGETKRILELTFELVEQNIWPKLSTIEKAKNDQFSIEKNFTLNDSLYIGGDVDVHQDASIGDPPGDRTTIFVPTGKQVTGNFDANFSWAVHPQGAIGIPGFDHTKYDSLINIAQSISSSSGNKYLGNFTINGGTFNLSNYENNTFFIKGKLTVKGAVITGGSISNPGIIVTTKVISVRKRGGIQSVINDNIIFISNQTIDIKDASQFGIDYSAISPSSRPKTVNEIYAKGNIKIQKDSETWAQIISRNEVLLSGRAYGFLYATQGLEFDNNNSFLEGALFVRQVLVPQSKLRKGEMNLNHYYPMHYFSGIQYKYVPHSLREI